MEYKYIKYDDAPESWSDRCSGDGHERIINKNGDRVYKDNGESVELGYRPCAKCGQFPTKEGHDSCLGTLDRVINACCGHGTKEGYIQFDNGVIIRGYFTVEHFQK